MRRGVPNVRSFLPAVPVLAITMNQPATFVHWSIFDGTVANLVLIAVMVAIFGAALLLPFPKGRAEAVTAADSAADGTARADVAGAAELPDDGAAGLWRGAAGRRGAGE